MSVGPRVPSAPVEYATLDLLVELGPETDVFVAKGHRIPPSLVGLPQIPR